MDIEQIDGVLKDALLVIMERQPHDRRAVVDEMVSWLLRNEETFRRFAIPLVRVDRIEQRERRGRG